jgi:hypothetical protein
MACVVGLVGGVFTFLAGNTGVGALHVVDSGCCDVASHLNGTGCALMAAL